MFGNRPPHPNQERPPHPQGGQQQQRPPHPQGGQQQGGERNAPPLLTERDSQLLVELLGDDEQAQALFGTLQNAPPELAALGFLMLRIYERTR
ncbi:hypothetical protein [Chamaesiphon sp. VAR_69_metabat_338]|uniref:hypothetical protein n=1 Tax=Chamaesiphon sp. VAR_69_metabat_338 TaxID=2964704 RepID=UPI00286E3453|nr:hypothetical protein [Chamaesiphon sp. VAR_69_metabat_338]